MHFMTVSLTNGSLVSFSFNPGILAKLSQIQIESEKTAILAQSLVKFAGIFHVGAFVKSQAGRILVNECNEVYEAVLSTDGAKQAMKLEKVTYEQSKTTTCSPFGAMVVENEVVSALQVSSAWSGKPQMALLIREGLTSQLVLHIGHIQSREQRSRKITVPSKQKIQKVKVIEQFNLVAVCCYRELSESLTLSTYSSGSLDLDAEFDNQILLLNSRTGEDLSDPKRLPQSQIPQHIEYLEQE